MNFWNKCDFLCPVAIFFFSFHQHLLIYKSDVLWEWSLFVGQLPYCYTPFDTTLLLQAYWASHLL